MVSVLRIDVFVAFCAAIVLGNYPAISFSQPVDYCQKISRISILDSLQILDENRRKQSKYGREPDKIRVSVTLINKPPKKNLGTRNCILEGELSSDGSSDSRECLCFPSLSQEFVSPLVIRGPSSSKEHLFNEIHYWGVENDSSTAIKKNLQLRKCDGKFDVPVGFNDGNCELLWRVPNTGFPDVETRTNFEPPIDSIVWAAGGWFGYSLDKDCPNSKKGSLGYIFIDKLFGHPTAQRNSKRIETCGNNVTSYQSVNPSGLAFRDFDLNSVGDKKVRIAYQTGVRSDTTVDQDIVLRDLCLNEKVNDDSKGWISEVHCNSDDSFVRRCSNDYILPENFGWEGKPKFSPNGSWIAYLRHDSATDESETTDIWVMQNPAYLGNDEIDPMANSDIDYCAEKQGQEEKAVEKPEVIGKALNITTGLEYPILDFEWSCLGACLIISASVEGKVELYQLNYGSRVNSTRDHLDILLWDQIDSNSENNFKLQSNVEPILEFPGLDYIKEFKVSKTGKTLFVITGSLDSHHEKIYRCGRKSTNPNIPFRQSNCAIVSKTPENHNKPRPTAMSFDDCADIWPNLCNGQLTVPGYVIVPPDYDDKKDYWNDYKIAFYVHGGPTQTMYNQYHYLLNELAQSKDNEIESNYIVIVPNVRGSIGFGVDKYGKDYRKQAAQNWGQGPYDDLIEVLNYFSRSEHKLNTDFYGIGESYGGYMMNWLLVNGGERNDGEVALNEYVKIKSLVPIYGVFDLESFACETDQKWFVKHQIGTVSCDPQSESIANNNPADFWDHQSLDIPTFVIHGREDKRVLIDQSYMLASKLVKRQQLPKYEDSKFKCYWFDGGHQILPNEWPKITRMIVKWFEDPMLEHDINSCKNRNELQ